MSEMPNAEPTDEPLSAVVVGAGLAGVCLSYCLTERSIEHIVLEKDHPFADWRRHRWDSFRMNTPNWMNVLPGEKQPFAPGADRRAYGSRADALAYFDAYLRAVAPPLRIALVTGVSRGHDGLWRVATPARDYVAANVILCTGHANEKWLPAAATSLPHHVKQFHSSEYRNPEQIDSKNVLIVGSGSSGVQICEELARSRRYQAVHLAVSGNFTLPWSVLGISSYAIIRRLGLFKLTRRSWLGRRLFPGLLRRGDPATPPAPNTLSRKWGVRLVGKVREVEADAIRCSDGRSVPLLDLTVVWCTGFRAFFEYVDPAVRLCTFDEDNRPIHVRGVAQNAPGLYFLGLRFQHTLLSQDLYGIGQDAAYIADCIEQTESKA